MTCLTETGCRRGKLDQTIATALEQRTPVPEKLVHFPKMQFEANSPVKKILETQNDCYFNTRSEE